MPLRCLLVAGSIFLLACGGGGESPRETLAEARKALAEGRYPDVLQAADQALAGGGADEVTAWGLELVKLEALARSGDGDATLAQLAKLATERPTNMGANQYAATADQLRAAGAGPFAIQALDAGLQRFPDDGELKGQIEAAKQAATDPGSDELEMLRSLGYVE